MITPVRIPPGANAISRVYIAVRGALTTAAGVGIFAANFSLSSDHGSDAGVLIGGLIALGGAGMIATGTVLDVINAPRAAAKHHLAIAPMVSSKQSGFAIAGTF